MKDVSPAFAYLVRYPNSEQSEARVRANYDKKLFVKLFWAVMSPLEGYLASTIYQNFQNDIEGFLLIWLEPRWLHDHLELFIDDGAEYSLVNHCEVPVRAPGFFKIPKITGSAAL
jgi:hypothetical protein